MKRFDEFLKQYPLKSYPKGTVILCEGDVPLAAYVIKRGVIKTYNLTEEGLERPISFDIAGEMFPVGWIFSKLERSQYFYESFTDCEIYVMPREDFLGFLHQNPAVLFELFNYFVSRYLNFQMRVYGLEQSKAVDKVLYTLHFLSLRFGRDVKKDMVRIELPLTQQDFANFVGLTRETAGIELKKLERAGIIRYQRQNYVVLTDKLNERLDVDYETGRYVEDERYAIRA
jgi:CRP/FNR family transcriptional regulator